METKIVPPTSDTDWEERTKRWQHFIEERRILFNAGLETSKQLSRAILTLSGGSLALSLTFLKDVEPHPSTSLINLLSLGWTSFATSILATVLSFYFCQLAYDKQIWILDQLYKLSEMNFESISEYYSRNFYSQIVKWLDLLSVILLLAGIGLTIVFSHLSLVD